jgi:hypothetical protein
MARDEDSANRRSRRYEVVGLILLGFIVALWIAVFVLADLTPTEL